jgi:hypothetical protein
MEVAEIAALITGVLKFPGAVLEFIKILKKTPQENHEALLKRMNDESRIHEDTGRPTWH